MTNIKPLVFFLLLLIVLLHGKNAFSCSMYKITIDGKTIVGNNEDSWRTTSKIWFEEKSSDKFGVAYVGYSEKPHPDGAINEFGLVFDAFTARHKKNVPPKDQNKKDFSYLKLKTIMQECKTVDEVYLYLEKLNLTILNGSPLFYGSMLLFIDKSGKYLVVEADKMTFGNESEFVLSNFSVADTKDISTVKIKRYWNGVNFLKNNQADTTLSFCTRLADTMSVNRKKIGDGTLYTTIYDLKNGIIYTYFFHDFTKVVTFNLTEELNKGNHSYIFSDLFPENKGYIDFVNYKTPQNSDLILWTLIISCILFLISSLYFIIVFLKSIFKNGVKKPAYNNLKLGLALLLPILSYYSLVLIKNQAIFYFPSPYSDDGSSFANPTSYLPIILLTLIIPLVIINFRVFKLDSWSHFSKWLFVANNFMFTILLGIYGYWDLFNVFN